jgi:hypothetical protein
MPKHLLELYQVSIKDIIDYPIQSIRMNNAGEFTSQAFYDYCMSIEINIEHHVAHTHIILKMILLNCLLNDFN